MGKLKRFGIILNNVAGVYFAGQTVDGYLTVELNQEMKMREIRLTFHGLAIVHWTESRTTGSGKDERTVTDSYDANDWYFNHIIPLYGKDFGHPESLSAGSHTFPFSCLLPSNLPSSFEGEAGYVRYTIKATIDKPWRFNHNTKRPFTVVSLLDLNLQPNSSSGAQGHNFKTLCCFCCKSGPISGTVWIDRIGYVPGEAIEINAEVENLSNRVCHTSARLTMYTTFHATTKSTGSKKEVTRVNHPAVKEGKEDIWSREKLRIPPIPPSFLVGCNIIDIKYMLEFIIDPSGPAIKLLIPLEIIIGTIPLRSVAQRYQSPSSQSMVSHMGPSTPHPLSVIAMSDLPPPSYEDCMFGKVNIKDDDDNEHTSGELSYAPKYTYYNYHQPN